MRQNSVKKTRRKVLTLIYMSDVRPMPSTELRKRLGMSRQALNYHINRLVEDKLIKVSVSDACDFYEPTDNGIEEASKDPTVGLMKPSQGLHNIAFKFKILSGKDFHLKKSRKMRGWTCEHCHFDGHYIEKTPTYLIVFPIKKGERMYGTDAFELKQRARDKAMEIAQRFVDRYDLRLSAPEISRKEHFGIQNELTKFFKKVEVSTDEFKFDDSEGNGGEIDIFTPQAANEFVAGIRHMPARMDRMERNMERISEQMAVYAKHLNAHIPALEGLVRQSAIQVPVLEELKKMVKNINRRVFQRRIGEFL